VRKQELVTIHDNETEHGISAIFPLLHLDQIGSCFKIVVHSESQEISTISFLQVVGSYLIFLRL